MTQFETSDRRLEQFLHAHFIRFDAQKKDDRGYTVWRYSDTPRLQEVVTEYKTLVARYSTAPTMRSREGIHEKHD